MTLRGFLRNLHEYVFWNYFPECASCLRSKNLDPDMWLLQISHKSYLCEECALQIAEIFQDERKRRGEWAEHVKV